MMNEINWQSQIFYPALALLQLIPLFSACLILYLKKEYQAKIIGLSMAFIQFAITFHLYWLYDKNNSAMQFAEHWDFWGLHYHVAIDGISILFMLLTSLLTILVMFYALLRNLPPYTPMFAVFLLTEACLMSMFTTMNLLWFTIVSVLQIIPMAYLIERWSSSPSKSLAITRYIQFMFIAMIMLFAGTFILGWNYVDTTKAAWSFDLYHLIKADVPPEIRSAVFFLFFYAFAIRVPLFPMHGWLLTLMEYGSIAVAPIFLLGIKVGIYGVLRFVFPLFPEAIMQWQPFIIAFAVAGIFYAAVLALLQQNLRRLLAYAILSHTSVVVIGLFTLDNAAFQGSIMLTINYGIATAGLLFMVGLVFGRTKTMLLSRLGGLFPILPIIGITFFVAGLAVASMPGTPGFDAAHLMLEDAMHRFGALITIAAALGNVVAAAFLLLAFQRAFLAPPKEGTSNKHIQPTTLNEKCLSLAILFIILGVGFYSDPWLTLVETPVNQLSLLFHIESGH